MKLKTLLLTAPLILMGLHAESMSGTTIGHYAKPGAPIDMTYLSHSTDNNESSKKYDVNITLTTTVRYGTMKVKVTFDDALIPLTSIDKELSFEITPEQKKYPINMQVSAKEDGLHYIRLLTKIDKGRGSKLRAFAVPVQVGEKKILKRNSVMMKSHSGENISISKAVETISVPE
ncbi:hypothetical protein MNB_SV-14-160 [hydrothermal vent metagenome]|uniref:Uncharacterized protein n=1 Tax=hydrothermal vent metagenome TaxID=652676 RepID=A0A1W1CNW5_9ZZZZ